MKKTGTTGKAAENKRQKREALLNTAFDLFTAQGINNTSISNIAEKAGVAKGTFYLYFKDKYDLRDLLVRHKALQILQHACSALDATELTTLEDKLCFMADSIISQLSENRSLTRFITKNLSWGLIRRELSISAGAPPEDEMEELIHRFQQAFERSDVKYKDPEIMLYIIVELIGSSCYSSIMENVPVPIDQLRPKLIDSIRAIMRSQELPPDDSEL